MTPRSTNASPDRADPSRVHDDVVVREGDESAVAWRTPVLRAALRPGPFLGDVTDLGMTVRTGSRLPGRGSLSTTTISAGAGESVPGPTGTFSRASGRLRVQTTIDTATRATALAPAHGESASSGARAPAACEAGRGRRRLPVARDRKGGREAMPDRPERDGLVPRSAMPANSELGRRYRQQRRRIEQLPERNASSQNTTNTPPMTASGRQIRAAAPEARHARCATGESALMPHSGAGSRPTDGVHAR